MRIHQTQHAHNTYAHAILGAYTHIVTGRRAGIRIACAYDVGLMRTRLYVSVYVRACAWTKFARTCMHFLMLILNEEFRHSTYDIYLYRLSKSHQFLKEAVPKWKECLIFLIFKNGVVHILFLRDDCRPIENVFEKRLFVSKYHKNCSSQPVPIRRWRMLRSSIGSCRPPRTEKLTVHKPLR